MQDEAGNVAAPATSAETYNLVTFRLGQEVYALPIEAIIKIISMVTITSIPRVHESVEGIINVRGAAVPVINLRRYLGVPEVPLGLHTPIILVQVSKHTMGLIVDEVIDVQEIDGERVARLGDIMPEKLGDVPILDGIVHMPEGTILLLNIDQLFMPSQIEALTRVVDALPESFVEGAVGDRPEQKDRPTEAEGPEAGDRPQQEA
jgi:purine-binding chemotaxis protein CheW